MELSDDVDILQDKISMKISIIVGTRPEIIKMSSISLGERSLAGRQDSM